MPVYMFKTVKDDGWSQGALTHQVFWNEYVIESEEAFDVSKMAFHATSLVNAERYLYPESTRFKRVTIYEVDGDGYDFSTKSHCFYPPPQTDYWPRMNVAGFRQGNHLDRWHTLTTLRNRIKGRALHRCYFGAVSPYDVNFSPKQHHEPPVFSLDTDGTLGTWWHRWHSTLLDRVNLISPTASVDKSGHLSRKQAHAAPTMLGFISNQKHLRKKFLKPRYSLEHNIRMNLEKAQDRHMSISAALYYIGQQFNHTWGDGNVPGNWLTGFYEFIASVAAVWYPIAWVLGFTIYEPPKETHWTLFPAPPIGYPQVHPQPLTTENIDTIAELIRWLYMVEKWLTDVDPSQHSAELYIEPVSEFNHRYADYNYNIWNDAMRVHVGIGQALNLFEQLLNCKGHWGNLQGRWQAPADEIDAIPTGVKIDTIREDYNVIWFHYLPVPDREPYLTTPNDQTAIVQLPHGQPRMHESLYDVDEGWERSYERIDEIYAWLQGAADAIEPVVDLLPRPWWWDAFEYAVNNDYIPVLHD